MKNLLFLFIGLLLTAGCQRFAAPVSQVVPLPDALQAMAVGDSANLGYGFIYTRLNDTKALRTAPVAQAARKCKNCGNTTYIDKSETTVKDKSEQVDRSKVKDHRDHRVQPEAPSGAEQYSSWFLHLVKQILLWIGGIVVLLLVLRYVVLRRFFVVALIVGAGMLASCSTAHRRYPRPLHKPTFLKDEGHQSHKFSSAGRGRW